MTSPESRQSKYNPENNDTYTEAELTTLLASYEELLDAEFGQYTGPDDDMLEPISAAEPVTDPDAESYYDEVLENIVIGELSAELKEIINSLNPRNAEIVRKSFGLFGERKHSRAELAASLGVTGERIRQLEKVIVNRILRYQAISRGLNNYHEDTLRFKPEHLDGVPLHGNMGRDVSDREFRFQGRKALPTDRVTIQHADINYEI